MALKNGMLLIFQSFKKDKVLRIFKLSSGQDDHAIMFMDDYLKQVCLSPGSALIGSLGDSNWSTNLLSYISDQSHGEPSVLERVEADISLCSLPGNVGNIGFKNSTRSWVGGWAGGGMTAPGILLR